MKPQKESSDGVGPSSLGGTTSSFRRDPLGTADVALSGLYTFAVSDIVICGNSKYPFASVGSKMPTTTTTTTTSAFP